MEQDEIKKIAIEMVKKKHGNWYKLGDESTEYYHGIIDGINKVLNDPNAFANIMSSRLCREIENLNSRKWVSINSQDYLYVRRMLERLGQTIPCEEIGET